MQYPPDGSQPLPPPYPNYTQYPPQPQFTKPTKPKRWPWIIALIVTFFIGYSLGHSSTSGTPVAASNTNTQQQSTISQDKQQPTSAPAPTKPPKPQVWTTVQTFTGNGSKKTGTFTVPDHWKIVWTCNPASFDNINYNVIIDVDNSDGSTADAGAVNAMCRKGSLGGETEERGTAGQVFLSVVSEGDWTISVQVLK